MKLREQLLSLVAPLGVGDELLHGVRLADVSAELGLRLRFETAHGPMHVELGGRSEDRPRAAVTKQVALWYRGGCVPSDLGQRVCVAVADLVAQNEDEVLAGIRASNESTGKIREVHVEQALQPHGSLYGLSPYAGCLIGCRFCYAQSRLDPWRRLLGLPAVPWGSYVDVHVNLPQLLREELQTTPPAPIKFCPILSDPYHGVERRYRVTRQCLEVLADAPPGFTVMLLTRSIAILDDMEHIAALPSVRGGVSLPTVDDEVREHFEPRAASVSERLAVLSTLRRAGVPTHVVVQPLLPGSLEALVDALAEHADSVSLGPLQGVEDAGCLFADPRYRHARADSWQRNRLNRARHLLAERGVRVWSGELPPDLEESA